MVHLTYDKAHHQMVDMDMQKDIDKSVTRVTLTLCDFDWGPMRGEMFTVLVRS